jgi:hypothetical protein
MASNPFYINQLSPLDEIAGCEINFRKVHDIYNIIQREGVALENFYNYYREIKSKFPQITLADHETVLKEIKLDIPKQIYTITTSHGAYEKENNIGHTGVLSAPQPIKKVFRDVDLLVALIAEFLGPQKWPKSSKMNQNLQIVKQLEKIKNKRNIENIGPTIG